MSLRNTVLRLEHDKQINSKNKSNNSKNRSINKMLDVNGIVVFDDSNWKSIGKLVKHAETYPAYKTLEGGVGPRWHAFQKVEEDSRQWDWYKDF